MPDPMGNVNNWLFVRRSDAPPLGGIASAMKVEAPTPVGPDAGGDVAMDSEGASVRPAFGGASAGGAPLPAGGAAGECPMAASGAPPDVSAPAATPPPEEAIVVMPPDEPAATRRKILDFLHYHTARG